MSVSVEGNQLVTSPYLILVPMVVIMQSMQEGVEEVIGPKAGT